MLYFILPSWKVFGTYVIPICFLLVLEIFRNFFFYILLNLNKY